MNTEPKLPLSDCCGLPVAIEIVHGVEYCERCNPKLYALAKTANEHRREAARAFDHGELPDGYNERTNRAEFIELECAETLAALEYEARPRRARNLF